MIDLVINPLDPELEPLGPSADGSKYRPVTVTVAPSRVVRLAAGGFLWDGAPLVEQIPTSGSLTVSVPATDGAEIHADDRSTFEYVVTITATRVGKQRSERTVTFRGMLPTSLGATVQVTSLDTSQPIPAPYVTASQFMAEIGTQISTAGTAANNALVAEVGEVQDPATASLLDNPASATRAALNSALVRGANVSRFITRAKTGEALKVVALGDSIWAGTGATAGTNDSLTLVAAGLASRFGTTVTTSNRALSGATSAVLGIVGNVESAIADQGDLYIISLGRNDVPADNYPTQASRGWPLAKAMRSIESMVREIRRRVPKADILIASENPATPYNTDALMRTYVADLARLAHSLGCEYVDVYAAYAALGDYSSKMLDAVHPNVAGHALTADTVLAAFPQKSVAPTNAPGTPGSGGSLHGAHLIDPTVGNTGWMRILGVGSANSGVWSLSGSSWTAGPNPYVATTAGDYAEFTFTGTDLLVSLSADATDNAVVDIVIDGATAYTNQSLTLIPTSAQPFIAVAKSLTAARHTVRIVLKSGTLRVYQAAWLAPATSGSSVTSSGGGLRRMLPGRFYTAQREVATTTFLNSGDAYAVPVWVPAATTVDRLAVDVTQAAAGSTITLGLYGADDYDQPATRLVVASALDTSTTGFKQATVSATLQPGWYWLSLLGLGGFAASSLRVRGTNLSTPLVTTSSTTMANSLNCYLVAGQASLPATWTSTAAATAGPLIAVRAA